MGYSWPVEVDHPEAGLWVGEQRSELVELDHLFGALVHMEPEEDPNPEVWRAVMPTGVRFVRKLGPRTVHVRVKRGEVRDIAIRIALPSNGGLRRLTNQVRHSRAQRRYMWAHRLRALGIDTPRPLGYIERARQPAFYKSFAASEYIYAPTLIEFRDERVAQSLQNNPDAVLEKRALIARVAELMRELHSHDLYPVDLQAKHLLVAEGGVVITDVVEFASRFSVGQRAALRNLNALAEGFTDGRSMTRTDRLRFLDAYLRHSPRRDEARRRLFVRATASLQLVAPTA